MTENQRDKILIQKYFLNETQKINFKQFYFVELTSKQRCRLKML